LAPRSDVGLGGRFDQSVVDLDRSTAAAGPADRVAHDEERAMEGKGRGRLLLVEDEAVLRRLIAEFLRGEGFDVVEAADGAQGATLYAGHCPFDLVLLDLNLPLLSGVDVCRRIKALRPQQPVLICSAAILDWHVAELLELEVDQFLTKPYHPLDLLDRIAREMARGAMPVAPFVGPGPAASGSRDAASRGVRSLSSYPVQSATAGLR
jgi:DNA-binding response OmpR family regulator